jgi:hypothetical protein
MRINIQVATHTESASADICVSPKKITPEEQWLEVIRNNHD